MAEHIPKITHNFIIWHKWSAASALISVLCLWLLGINSFEINWREPFRISLGFLVIKRVIMFSGQPLSYSPHYKWTSVTLEQWYVGLRVNQTHVYDSDSTLSIRLECVYLSQGDVLPIKVATDCQGHISCLHSMWSVLVIYKHLSDMIPQEKYTPLDLYWNWL